MSRYAMSTMRRTSRTWEAGIDPLPVPLVEGSAPQNSRACSDDMTVPFPANSRSRGRKTACMYGRIDVNVKSHISTRWGMRRSSGVRRRVRSRDEKPVVRRSRKSSMIRLGDLFWKQRWKCVLVMLASCK